MLVLHDPLRQTDLPRGCVATIGNFDGMHVGHQAIVRGVVERARELGRPSAVVTFDPHPLAIVAPDRMPKQILTLSQKEELLRAMDVALGRTYFIDGRVATGRRLGRKIGFPTVNVDPSNELFPGGGVYITTSRFESFNRSFESVTNIGVRPTLYENYAITIESHILDFDSNVYDDNVRLFFHELIRRERQFRSAVELTDQIREDIEMSRLYFQRHSIRCT